MIIPHLRVKFIAPKLIPPITRFSGTVVSEYCEIYKTYGHPP